MLLQLFIKVIVIYQTHLLSVVVICLILIIENSVQLFWCVLIKMYLRNKKFELSASRQLSLVELNQQYLFHQALQQSLVDFDL